VITASITYDQIVFCIAIHRTIDKDTVKDEFKDRTGAEKLDNTTRRIGKNDWSKIRFVFIGVIFELLKLCGKLNITTKSTSVLMGVNPI
jgi:hypothetical protein